MHPVNGKRVFRFTEEACKDLEWLRINVEEWESIWNELSRLCEVANIAKDAKVDRIIQCESKWRRLKIQRPSEIRVFFTTYGQDQDMVVRAVLRRTDRTYDIAEIFYKARNHRGI